MAILAIDFGGTRARAGWFDPTLNLLVRSEMLTEAEKPRADVIERLLALARGVIPARAKIEAVGISAPNPKAHTGLIQSATVLPGWDRVPLAQIVSDAFGGVPVYMENDGNLGALAETALGAGRGADPAAYLTISTSIGGGVVIGGRLLPGADGLAFEPGHIQFPQADGTLRGLEYLAAGPGLARLAARRLATSDVDSALRTVPISGGAVGAAAHAGDPLALAAVREAGEWLGLGLLAVVHLFNPAAIVLGGGVALGLGDLLLDPARAVIHAHVIDPAFDRPDLLRLAQLGDDVCLIGAAAYAIQQIDPAS